MCWHFLHAEVATHSLVFVNVEVGMLSAVWDTEVGIHLQCLRTSRWALMQTYTLVFVNIEVDIHSSVCEHWSRHTLWCLWTLG